MVVEYIRYTVPAERSADFEQAYKAASGVLDEDPHCLAYEIAQGVEEPEHYTVRIEWDSVEGHEQGFRRSARFGEFFTAVKPFFAQIQEMKHYTVRFGARR
ncbi:antibiotic biosynthesis monooxygenase family protein [Streptosporangium sp. CA-135522]|uniref:antibiotic biosynthesis monooxygenase family protein n=1 Tax=Streptosporangium sp. CA-135522 TaxID=3240072 RepID=UPI003D918C81